jgi:predicted TIM-barrel fold metal-dependent hydrolase
MMGVPRGKEHGMDFAPGADVSRIKARLDHPVIDSDGHAIEYLPLVRDILHEQAGADATAAFDLIYSGGGATRGLTPLQMRAAGLSRTSWWGLPARNTLDRGTALLPRLLARRLPEMGIDHAILYPTYGLVPAALDDADVRRALARAFNTFYAQAFAEHAELLTPVGIIPMHSPDEAIAELEHATGELGLKAFMFGGPISRPVPGVDPPTRTARWLDSLGLDSAFDYDPVWAKCVELGVAPTFHTAAMGWTIRQSVSSYVFNHIGMFAIAGETTALSLFLGGVPSRFPSLRFAFQEGGVAWAAALYANLLGHWEKRNRDAVEHYNPAHLDRDLLVSLFDEYGTDSFRDRLDRLDDGLRMLSQPDEDPATIDEFARSGIESREDIHEVFTTSYHFGCEADDPMTALAFDTGRNPMQARLRALFASDIGHWDVPDVRGVLTEAWELVEDGHATEADFRALTFENAVSLWAGGNPSFFAGTSVEGAVAAELTAPTTQLVT